MNMILSILSIIVLLNRKTFSVAACGPQLPQAPEADLPESSRVDQQKVNKFYDLLIEISKSEIPCHGEAKKAYEAFQERVKKIN